MQNPSDPLSQLAQHLENRRSACGGDPTKSYTARLLLQGPNAFLKKIGEEATEVVMAAKDTQPGGATDALVNEMADLWFHCVLALGYYGLSPQAVFDVLEKRKGLSGLEEKAKRQAQS
jgi:phosphoribosyl-ATP pyrophosphohydrolase